MPSSVNSSNYLISGTQNGSTHIYLQSGTLASFTNSIASTFGGSIQQGGTAQITPTPSTVKSAFVFTPVGNFTGFEYTTPVPKPFGNENYGFMVSDMEQALLAARQLGASVMIEPFPDALGRDAVLIWPNGVQMQLFQHFKPQNNQSLKNTPETRLYIPVDRADEFIHSYSQFSLSILVQDRVLVAGDQPISDGALREVHLTSETSFGNTHIFVTNGHLNVPFGYEVTGYAVDDFQQTYVKAVENQAKTLWSNYQNSAIIEFPGGYKAEIHQK